MDTCSKEMWRRNWLVSDMKSTEGLSVNDWWKGDLA